jgi:hypothetical protein
MNADLPLKGYWQRSRLAATLALIPGGIAPPVVVPVI